MSAIPRFWGSRKGLVLKAIAIDGARTWREIRASSKLCTEDLNQELSELFSSNILSKSGDDYWIEQYDLYREYRDYGEEKYDSPYLDKSKQEQSERARLFSLKLEKIGAYIELNQQRVKNTVIGGVLGWTLRNGVALPQSTFTLMVTCWTGLQRMSSRSAINVSLWLTPMLTRVP